MLAMRSAVPGLPYNFFRVSLNRASIQNLCGENPKQLRLPRRQKHIPRRPSHHTMSLQKESAMKLTVVIEHCSTTDQYVQVT